MFVLTEMPHIASVNKTDICVFYFCIFVAVVLFDSSQCNIFSAFTVVLFLFLDYVGLVV